MILVLSLITVLVAPSMAQEQQFDIASLLPRSGEAGEWYQSDSVRIFAGDNLFDFIDGGADIYFEYGFTTVVSAEYQNSRKIPIRVEIYEMTGDAAAFGMYSISIGSQGKSVKVGNEGTLNDYYLVFWKERFLIFISSDDTTGETLEGILELAECADKNINGTGKKPEAVSLLPKENRTTSRFVRGFLGLSSIYDFDSKNIFGVREGSIGDYKNYRVFLFRYSSENDAEKWYANARAILATATRMSNFRNQGQQFTMIDRKGSQFGVTQRGNLVVVVMAGQESDITELCEKVVSAIEKSR